MNFGQRGDESSSHAVGVTQTIPVTYRSGAGLALESDAD